MEINYRSNERNVSMFGKVETCYIQAKYVEEITTLVWGFIWGREH